MEELYGRGYVRKGSNPDRPAKWVVAGLEESRWRLRELYPERPGVSDCVYYMQTGLCGFGNRCRYNHPRDRALAIAAARIVGGQYPERPEEPVCQYFLKTGTCKFGATCKFNHPRNAGGSLAKAPLNYHGYPLRPGEKECSYYLKTGQCKFGITCKFHHPQPAGVSMRSAAPPFYPKVQLSSVPMLEQATVTSPSYRIARPLLVPGSYVPGNYGPLLPSPGVVPMPGWTSYSGPVSPVLSPGAQRAVGAGSVFGLSPLSPSVHGLPGSYHSLPFSGGLSNNVTKDHTFPQRPGELECQYYLKTGNCKFGAACKYHHPPDRTSSTAACFLGPLGLPLRPGTEPCIFYLQNGYCKYGPTCKFDHPIGIMKYTPAPPLTEIPVRPVHYLPGSSLPTLSSLSSSADFRPPCGLKSNWSAESNKMTFANASAGLTFTQTTSMNVQQSSHCSSHSRRGE